LSSLGYPPSHPGKGRGPWRRRRRGGGAAAAPRAAAWPSFDHRRLLVGMSSLAVVAALLLPLVAAGTAAAPPAPATAACLTAMNSVCGPAAGPAPRAQEAHDGKAPTTQPACLGCLGAFRTVLGGQQANCTQPDIAAFCATLACSGRSSSLEPAQCATWQVFYDRTFGAAKHCKSSRNDPCGGCSQGVQCNGSDIIAITLGELNLQGNIVDLPRSPVPAINWPALKRLQVLELGFNNLSGVRRAFLSLVISAARFD
jgi:hypothetical protein